MSVHSQNGSSSVKGMEELKTKKESLAAYVLRYIPRAFYRWLQSFQAEKEIMWLKGALAPAKEEIFSKNLHVIEGSIPSELEGLFVRTGPNPQFKPFGGYHWFDGEAMLHAVQIMNGEAKTYCNHWLRCKRFLMESAAGCNLAMRLGDLKGAMGLLLMYIQTAFSWLLMPYANTHAEGNTALVWHGRSLLALNEASPPFLVRLCAGMLRSIGSVMWGGESPITTAHPKVDFKSGELLAFTYALGGKTVRSSGSSVAYFTVGKDGTRSKDYPVDVQKAQMMHDFLVSPTYVLFMDHALVFDGEAMVKKGTLPFSFDKSRKSRLGIMRRSDPAAGLQWFEVDPFSCQHTCGMWEEGSKVFAVICSYEHLSLDAQSWKSNAPGNVVRYELDTETGLAKCTPLTTGYNFDFPVVPQHLATETGGYCYTTGGFDVGAVERTVIAKVDMYAGENQGIVSTITLPGHITAEEFSFASRAPPSVAAGKDEDDGFLLGFATDTHTLKSFLMVYDAKTMSETPLAMVAMPQRVPHGFHGLWVHKEQLDTQKTE